MAAPVDPPAYRKHDPPPTLRYEDYTIGWISALPEEAEAATHMLDDRDNGRFPFRPGDDNQYTPGEIAGHKVVIACLPKRTTGTVSAATLVSQMRQSFPNLRYGLMVGIGAGVPGQNLDPDIRLGDVVVASPSDISDSPVGVIGYELGAETVDGFKRRDWQAPTDRRLRNALESIERDARVEGSHDFLQHLKIFVGRNHGQKFRHPDVEDQLYKGDDTDELVPRQPRLPQDPAVHYGLIASGNKLVKKAELRDALRDKYGIICFEMEAAGLMNIMPVAVIRGVSDYADSRKNDVWHCYAAATAAAYAKGLLNVIGPESPARNDLGRGVEPPGDRVRVLKRLRVNGVGFLRRCGDGSVGSEYVEFVDAFVYGRVRVNIAGYMDYSRIKVEDL
ncbi:purine and uridine phosphorylase [Zopfia rhizophila CBS 207.26]|uniref:Purine and uridine phosphorylase n=1 Tax=Zopfia rhizophila CBS 207.26 TaxID=1314779 RepID=A0A6A6EYA1_9PEZI|nr:purine and uridine phosphorylase [Zopfia rhizophila CBS 207.26]